MGLAFISKSSHGQAVVLIEIRRAMENYQLPCYTFKEAQQALSLNRSELIHALQSEKITGVVYVKARPILLFSPRVDGTWYGYASCVYRGHLTLHKTFIMQLTDGDTITVGRNWGRLLDDIGVTHWNSQYPFKGPLPHNKISRWVGGDLDRLPLIKMAATPMPVEKEPTTDLLETLTNFLTPKESAESSKEYSPVMTDWALDFDKNSKFTPEDLRIPSSEIKRYQISLKISGEPSDRNPKKSRENQLHTLIERAIRIEPKASAKKLWQVMQKDVGSDSPIIDTDNIIQRMDELCIEWQSRNNVDQVLKWESFNTIVSRIRTRLKNT